MSISITFTFPMPLQPKDRHARLEDPLDEFLGEHRLGELSGGGTFLGDDNAVSGCDMTVNLEDSASIALVTARLNELGAAKGSTFQVDGGERQEFGRNEGLALFLDMDLPDAVMDKHDVGDLFQAIENSLSGAGQWMSSAQKDHHFILYLYGLSFDVMQQRLRPLLEKEPLMEA